LVRILALDLSKSRTGWACFSDADSKPTFGSWILGSEFTSNGKVFGKLHQNISELNMLGAIDCLFYEDAINILPGAKNTNVHAIKLAAGLIAHADSWGDAMGCRIVHPVNMKSWRRTFFGNIGRGHARKELKEYAVERCQQLGFNPRNDDEADAIGILDYACEYMQIIPPWRADEVLRPPLGKAP
jgi:hypothetical protein